MIFPKYVTIFLYHYYDYCLELSCSLVCVSMNELLFLVYSSITSTICQNYSHRHYSTALIFIRWLMKTHEDLFSDQSVLFWESSAHTGQYSISKCTVTFFKFSGNERLFIYYIIFMNHIASVRYIFMSLSFILD